MSPIRMERAESGVRTILAFTEALNHHDLPAMLQLISDHCVYEAPSPAPDGMVYKGKPAISQYWSELLNRMPDVHLKIEESFGYGLRSIIRWRSDFSDSTGHAAHLHGVDLFRIQNGLIIEHLSYIKA